MSKLINTNIKRNYRKPITIIFILAFLMLLHLMSIPIKVFASDYIEGEAAYDEIANEVIAKEFLVEDACVDDKSHCLDATKEKIIDGIIVTRECWKNEYIKNCNNGPSKNNCANIQQDNFNFIKDICLNIIKVGEKSHCINVKKVFAREYTKTERINRGKIIIDPDNKNAIRNVLCNAFCLDGSCSSAFKEERKDNDEIAASIAQLEMLSNIRKGLVDENNLKFDVFGASARKCHDKTTFFSNCCDDSGFLKKTGLTNCSEDQRNLASQRRSNKCEYVGDYCAKKIPVVKTCIRKSKSYCCFPTILSKLIRLGARDQLGKGFGSAEHPQCGGLTLEDIERLDFSKIDFQEFFDAEVQPMMKSYSVEDNEALVKRSFPSGSTDKGSNEFSSNGSDGVNEKLFQNSGEGGK